MAFRSRAQRRKFAELLLKGEISEEVYERWNRDTGGAMLPERVDPKDKRQPGRKRKPTRKSSSTRKSGGARKSSSRRKSAKTRKAGAPRGRKPGR